MKYSAILSFVLFATAAQANATVYPTAACKIIDRKANQELFNGKVNGHIILDSISRRVSYIAGGIDVGQGQALGANDVYVNVSKIGNEVYLNYSPYKPSLHSRTHVSFSLTPDITLECRP